MERHALLTHVINRVPEKPFLFQIVANKVNGLDVDKYAGFQFLNEST